MSSNQINTLFTPNAVALLRAVGSSAELSGAAHLLPNIRSCLNAAAKLWPMEQLDAWAQVASQMQRDLSEAKSITSGVATDFFMLPEQRTKIFEQFVSMQAPILHSGIAFEEYALLGRAIAQCAAANQMLSADLLSGLRTLARGRKQEGKGSRSQDWEKLPAINLTNQAALQQLLTDLPPRSPTSGFIKAATSVLRTVCPFPETIQTSPEEPESMPDEGIRDHEPNPLRSGVPNAQQKPTTNEDEDLDTGPDIKARLKAADYAPLGEKLGLYHRDHLILNDFAFITQQFPKIIKEGDLREQGFTILATLLTVTGCRDEVLLEMQFHPASSIWLNLGKGSWAWDFNQYRSFRGERFEAEEVQPVFTAWPAFLDEPLGKAFKDCPGAKTLNDLILEIQGADHFDLKGFRRFLRGCGHPAHPAYFGRMARSLTPVYLEITGSDMTAAMNTGFFSGSAPASLFYFGPSYRTLRARTTQVYERLGWGLPSALNIESGRAGCEKILTVDELQKGWSDLCEAINTVCDNAIRAKDLESIVEHCNRLMGLLATAFVIQTAHRSTRLDCLTVDALLTFAEAMVIHDKDQGDRVQPRLVPKTEAIKVILQKAVECCKLMHSQAQTSSKPSTFALALSDWVFCNWEISQGVLETVVLPTKAVADNAMGFFKSESNFGRSTWVTYLDEDSCNRWLIRSLTGHTRDVSRVHGPYFDVPPLEIAARLQLNMERTGARIFGATNISLTANELPPIEYGVLKSYRGLPVLCDRVPDPRTLLVPLTANVLVEWRQSEQIRKDLVSGRIDAPIEILAILHMLFIDHIPCAELCISALTDRHKIVKTISRRAGLSWTRSHFVHNTWLPIQSTSHKLLDQVGHTVFQRDELIENVCSVLRGTYPSAWPKSIKSSWSIVGSLAASFRRLSFPPSMCAVSDLTVPAPCLSEISNERLLGRDVHAAQHSQPVRDTLNKSRKKNEDARLLIQTLGKYSLKTQRHGEKINRAKLCHGELVDDSLIWSGFVGWIKDWVVDELARTHNLLPSSYKISSLATYTSTLLLAADKVSFSDDPNDWDDSDWVSWIKQIDLACREKPQAKALDAVDSTLCDRAKHALQALVTSLTRRYFYVPAQVHKLLGQSKKTITKHGSASSCLITNKNLDAAIAILKDWYQDYPADFAMADLRAAVCSMAPVRFGEVSSLLTDCLTPAGGLVLRRVGYDIHKNDNAVRVIRLAEEDAANFKKKRDALVPHFGKPELLLRNDGSPGAGRRDERVARDLTTALKLVTGDLQARPHSIRAVTMQEIAWPGWQQLAQAWAQGKIGPTACLAWLVELQKEYCRLATAVSMAGQGDLRSALGNYLSGWPMVYALHVTASLHELTPGPAFLEQLGISPASLRQARSRSQRQSSKFVGPIQPFETWFWLMNQLAKSSDLPRQPASPSAGKVEVTTSSVASEVVVESPIPFTSELLKQQYLTVRLLGMPAENAVEEVSIPFRSTTALEKLLPDEATIARVVSREREAPADRGKAGDIETATSEVGTVLMSWLQQLETRDFYQLKQAFFRDEPLTHPTDEKVKFWTKIKNSLPVEISLKVKIGIKHLDTAEISALNVLAPALILKPEKSIGARPLLSIYERGTKNLVTSSRMTSVARAACLALSILRNAKT